MELALPMHSSAAAALLAGGGLTVTMGELAGLLGGGGGGGEGQMLSAMMQGYGGGGGMMLPGMGGFGGGFGGFGGFGGGGRQQEYYKPRLLTLLAVLGCRETEADAASAWLRGGGRFRARCRSVVDMGPIPTAGGAVKRRLVVLRLRELEGEGERVEVAALLGAMQRVGALVPLASGGGVGGVGGGGDELPWLQVGGWQ